MHVRDANYDRLAAKLVNLAVEREQTMWKRAHEPVVTSNLRERLGGLRAGSARDETTRGRGKDVRMRRKEERGGTSRDRGAVEPSGAPGDRGRMTG